MGVTGHGLRRPLRSRYLSGDDAQWRRGGLRGCPRGCLLGAPGKVARYLGKGVAGGGDIAPAGPSVCTGAGVSVGWTPAMGHEEGTLSLELGQLTDGQVLESRRASRVDAGPRMDGRPWTPSVGRTEGQAAGP